MRNTAKTDSVADRSGWLWVWVGFALAALLAWQTGQYAQRNWEAPQRWDVVLNAQHYQIGDSQLQWLQDFSTAHFAADSDQARELLRAEISSQLDAAFALVSARLPEFADWYYSLGGEYSRISMALLGHLNVVDEGYVARHAASILFPQPAWENTLVKLNSEASELLVAQQSRSQAVWLDELQQRLSANRVPAPVSANGSETSALVLDGLVDRLRALQETDMVDTRLTLSTVGAAGVAGSTLWRVVSARAATKAAATAGAAKGAARVATRSASGAAAGAVACMPGGPLAVACAVAAAAGTWIATDWLLLQVDEALNRDEMLAGLEAGLADLRLGLEGELLEVHDARIAAWKEATTVQIEHTFSPRQAR